MSETIEVQEDGQIPIYTAIFLLHPVMDKNKSEALFAISPYHVTFHYSPGDPMFPEDVQEGDWAQIVHRGLYDDGEMLVSDVDIMRPFIKKDKIHERFYSYQYDRKIKDKYEKDVWRTGYPLHITWDSGKLPPVKAAERLESIYKNSDDPNWKYYTRLNLTDHFKSFISESTLEVNEIDKTNKNQVRAYQKRIIPIFNMMRPMGIWKTFKSEPKEQDLGV